MMSCTMISWWCHSLLNFILVPWCVVSGIYASLGNLRGSHKEMCFIDCSSSTPHTYTYTHTHTCIYSYVPIHHTCVHILHTICSYSPRTTHTHCYTLHTHAHTPPRPHMCYTPQTHVHTPPYCTCATVSQLHLNSNFVCYVWWLYSTGLWQTVSWTSMKWACRASSKFPWCSVSWKLIVFATLSSHGVQCRENW